MLSHAENEVRRIAGEFRQHRRGGDHRHGTRHGSRGGPRSGARGRGGSHGGGGGGGPKRGPGRSSDPRRRRRGR
jgi:hypothetical protein